MGRASYESPLFSGFWDHFLQLYFSHRSYLCAERHPAKNELAWPERTLEA
jgi:hypothetical protein